MTAGWTVAVVTGGGDIALEQLGAAGEDWYGDGPSGAAAGTIDAVLASCAPSTSDPEWLQAVAAVIRRDLAAATAGGGGGGGGGRRSRLLVIRASGTWYHATFTHNRSSIERHGLDWRQFSGSGIAGSRKAEAAGVFLCIDLESAQWFAMMGDRRGQGPVDIWAATLDGVWVAGAPDAGGGGDDNWVICPEPIAPGALTLIER
jgi:hypothetical protein